MVNQFEDAAYAQILYLEDGMIKIIVGGRFDYMKAAWSRVADDNK